MGSEYWVAKPETKELLYLGKRPWIWGFQNYGDDAILTWEFNEKDFVPIDPNAPQTVSIFPNEKEERFLSKNLVKWMNGKPCALLTDGNDISGHPHSCLPEYSCIGEISLSKEEMDRSILRRLEKDTENLMNAVKRFSRTVMDGVENKVDPDGSNYVLKTTPGNEIREYSEMLESVQTANQFLDSLEECLEMKVDMLKKQQGGTNGLVNRLLRGWGRS